MRSIVSACAVLWASCWCAEAQTSLFDQPLSPATPPGALMAPVQAPPAAPAPAPAIPTPAPAPLPVRTAIPPAQPKPRAAPMAASVAEPASSEPAGAKPKARPQARKPAPARSLTVSNDSTNTLTELDLTSDGATVKLGKALAPGEKAELKLPALKSCTATVSATFDRAAGPDTSDYDICKGKSLRFTD